MSARRPVITRKPDWRRARTALMCQGEPDRVPFIELGVHPIFKGRMLGRPCTAVADEIEFAQLAGYDYIKLQPGIDMNPGKILPAGAPGARESQLTEGGPVRKWANEHDGIIRNREEFERYQWPTPESVSYARLEEACRILPEGMGLIGQYGDIYTFIWESMGFETFAMALYEDPDLVAALFDRVGGIIFNLYENMIQLDRLTALWFSDDLAYTGGLMIAPDFFRDLLFPWVRRMGDLARSRDIPFLYHSDGVLWDVMDDLVDCGVTALHPIEPKSMDVADVKERAGGRLCVLGSVEVDTLCRGTEDEVRALVRDRVRRAGPGGGFCLGSSNSVPEYANYDNYIAMLEEGDRVGTYPLDL